MLEAAGYQSFAFFEGNRVNALKNGLAVYYELLYLLQRETKVFEQPLS